jgi:hypothetical protein
MSKKITVPEGMINAGAEALQNYDDCIPVILEAALRWLLDNALGTTSLELCEAKERILPSLSGVNQHVAFEQGATWVEKRLRQIFLAPEPEVPEAIKDLWDASPTSDTKRRTIEAYLRGKESSKR